jgi:hypothetical protein
VKCLFYLLLCIHCNYECRKLDLFYGMTSYLYLNNVARFLHRSTSHMFTLINNCFTLTS